MMTDTRLAPAAGASTVGLIWAPAAGFGIPLARSSPGRLAYAPRAGHNQARGWSSGAWLVRSRRGSQS